MTSVAEVIFRYTYGMDELEISGKRYISSRQAAKDHKYHPDYIGQLIRAKKVIGLKVGRAWYVEADALNDYFNTEAFSKVKEEKIIPISVDVPRSFPPVAVAVETVVSSPVHKMGTAEKSRASAEEDKPTILHIRKLTDEVFENDIIKNKGRLTYSTDSGPLFPPIERKSKQTLPLVAPPYQSHIISREPYSEIVRKNYTLPVLALGLIGIVTILLSALVSIGSASILSMGSDGQVAAAISFDGAYLASLMQFVK